MYHRFSIPNRAILFIVINLCRAYEPKIGVLRVKHLPARFTNQPWNMTSSEANRDFIRADVAVAGSLKCDVHTDDVANSVAAYQGSSVLQSDT